MNIFVIVSVTLIVVTKLFDVLSTIRHVVAASETNPIAGPLMKRYGV